MKLANPLASAMTEKNRDTAYKAVKQVLDNGDLDAWSCLVENADRIFPFVKENIAKNFSNIINDNNYQKLFSLFKIYSYDFDEYFAEILLKLSERNSQITDEMLELLKSGTEDEKTYAAKYFSFVKDNRAASYLLESFSSEFEPLKYNSAKALGDMKDEHSYNHFAEKLKSEDDWEKTEAVQFLEAYGDKKAFPLLLEAMANSDMPENIAGHIALLENISDYFGSENKETEELSLECFQHILASEAEIWPLSTIIDFKIYECLEKLIDLIKNSSDNIKGRYASLLLYANNQFSMFLENNEYKFNEDKETLAELDEIVALLKGQSSDFWSSCKNEIKKELLCNNTNRISFVIDIITELDLKEFAEEMKALVENQTDEIILYKCAVCLYKFGKYDYIDKNKLFEKITDTNLQAHINSLAALAN